MRLFLLAALAPLSLFACAHAHPHTPPRSIAEAESSLDCPSGTRAQVDGDVYGTLVACRRENGTLHGPSWFFSGLAIAGRYANGLEDGAFIQYRSDGTRVGESRFRTGTGLERRWYADGSRLEWQGRVVRGQRHGRWTYYKRNGEISMQEDWELGKVVRKRGEHFVNPIDENDSCPDDPSPHEREDGCP